MPLGNHTSAWSNSRHDTYRGWCHHFHMDNPQHLPLIGTTAYQSIRECWIRWLLGSFLMVTRNERMTTYCGRCCGQGGTGGGGLVKITYF